MSEAQTAGDASDAVRKSGAAALGWAGWLSLAATPTFAVMALLTGVFGGGPSSMVCTSAHDASPLVGMFGGMVPMYLLMSAFHSAPWKKVIFDRRTAACRS